MVAELESVGKRFGERWVVRNFSARILRGDRIGIVGPNGAGNHHLLKLILENSRPTKAASSAAPASRWRTSISCAPSSTELPLTEVISPGSEYVEIAGERKHVIGYLGEFLFSPARARSPGETLSGGERTGCCWPACSRGWPISWCSTNRPTISISRPWICPELLDSYDGTLFLVSHDRAFLDNVVTQVIAADGDGAWGEYVGAAAIGSVCARSARQRNRLRLPDASRSRAIHGAARRQGRSSSRSMKARTRGAARAIAALEAEQQGIQTRLADPAIISRRRRRCRR